MKLTIIKWLPAFALMTGCDSTHNQDFSDWTLAKTAQTQEGDTLFASFGSVSYKVYLNPVLTDNIKKSSALPVNSKAAIVVYTNNQDTAKSPALIGYLEKVQNSAGQSVWKATAIDSKGNSLTDEQIATACLSCHSLEGDSILLGKYVQ